MSQEELTGSSEDEINILDLLDVVTENLRLLVIGPLAAGLVAIGISSLITPTFTAKVTFLPPQQQQGAAASILQSLGALGGLAGAATGIKNPADQYVAFLKSASVADSLIERFQLMDRYNKDRRDLTRKALEGVTNVIVGKDGVMKLEVDDHDPQFAANLANAYVEELGRLMNRLAVTEAQQRRAFFDKKLKEAKENLTRAQQALAGTGVAGGAVRMNPGTSVGQVAGLLAQVAAKEVELGAMRNYLAPGSPEFIRAQAQLAALRVQLAKTEQSSKVPVAADEYVNKYRDFKYFETLFDLMAKQYEIARIDEAREGAVIQVIDSAIPPEWKSKPQRALVAVMSALAVGVLLLLYVFMRKSLNNGDSSARLEKIKQNVQRALGRD